MKIRALVTVLAIASGTAFAAQYNSDTPEQAANRNPTTAASTDAQPKKGGLIDKTKNAMHRMGDKMRSAMHRKDKSTPAAAKSDTSSMGAAGSQSQDGRQQRMDDAYASWKSNQK